MLVRFIAAEPASEKRAVASEPGCLLRRRLHTHHTHDLRRVSVHLDHGSAGVATENLDIDQGCIGSLGDWGVWRPATIDTNHVRVLMRGAC